jgi:regulator of sirC expression with transglutaminase-like and TPR domain
VTGGQDNGPIWVFERLADVCERLCGVAGAHLTKRLSFSAYELAARLPPKANIFSLSEFLFEDQGYRAVDDALADLSEILLPHVMQNRVGTPMALGVILRALAQKVGLEANFIQFPDLSILKSKEDGESLFMDLRRRGKILDRGEILEVLHKNKVTSDKISFEPLLDETILALYLKRVALEFQDRGEDLKTLIVYEGLLSLQPKNLSVLRDRSMAYYRLNRFDEALQDLKRFFSFSDPEQQPPELLELYSNLCRDLES